MPDFLKQEEQPVFPKLLWSRPQTVRVAGRLLLVGGQRHEFSFISRLHRIALVAGIGDCQVVLPDSLRLTLRDLDQVTFVPSSPAGSLGKAAAAPILDLAGDYDALAIGGDLTRHPETSALIERISAELARPIAYYDDALATLTALPKLLQQPEGPRLIICSMPGLIKLCSAAGVPIHIATESSLLNRVEIARTFSSNLTIPTLVTADHDLIAADSKLVSVTNLDRSLPLPVICALALTWWLQQPQRTFEALTTAAYLASRLSQAGVDFSSSQLTSIVEQITED